MATIGNPLIQNIPVANPITQEVLQEKLIIPTDTPYSTRKTKQAYNELVVYGFSPTNEGTYTTTVTADFSLLYLTLHLEGADKHHVLYLNDVAIAMLDTGTGLPIDQQFTFPGIIIRKGSILKLVATETGATALACLHNFIGIAL